MQDAAIGLKLAADPAERFVAAPAQSVLDGQRVLHLGGALRSGSERD